MSSPLSRFWKDSLEVKRVTLTTDEWNKEVETLDVVMTGVKCHLSQKILRSTDGEGNYQSMPEYKVFISSEYEVKQNYIFTVNRKGKIQEFRASEPMVYSGHQEIVVTSLEEGD